MAETHFDERVYAPVDAADQVSCRPDFAVGIYPGHMLENTTKEFEVNPEVPVTKDTPPTFIYHTFNDKTAAAEPSIEPYEALVKAGVPSEMHIFADGKHGSGLGKGDPALDQWPGLLESWLRAQGLLTVDKSAMGDKS